jgi:hypothetical protein
VSLKSQMDGGSTGAPTSFFDDTSFERVLPLRRVAFTCDFFGGEAALPTSANIGFPFIQKTVQTAGTPTVARVANAIAGVVSMALDSTSEKQEASVYFADSLEFDVTKYLEWEAVVQLQTLPSAAAVEMVWGLSSAWIDGPDNASYYVDFQCLANGAVNCRAYDGTTTTSKSSGVTLTAAGFHVFRLDCSDVTNLQFYIDGVKVSPTGSAAGIPFAATGANAVLQPYFSVYKASGVGVGTMYLDVVRCWQNRT